VFPRQCRLLSNKHLNYIIFTLVTWNSAYQSSYSRTSELRTLWEMGVFIISRTLSHFVSLSLLFLLLTHSHYFSIWIDYKFNSTQTCPLAAKRGSCHVTSFFCLFFCICSEASPKGCNSCIGTFSSYHVSTPLINSIQVFYLCEFSRKYSVALVSTNSLKMHWPSSSSQTNLCWRRSRY